MERGDELKFDETILTIARSLFKDINKPGCLIRLRASIFVGRRRGCSKAWAKYMECPLLDSLIMDS